MGKGGKNEIKGGGQVLANFTSWLRVIQYLAGEKELEKKDFSQPVLCRRAKSIKKNWVAKNEKLQI